MFYGWKIAFAACGITAVSAGVVFWSFGVFILPISAEFSWQRGEIAGAFSGGWLVQGLLGPLVGRAVARFGSRRLIIGGTLASGVSLVLVSTTTTLWQFYLFHLIFAFCRSWMFYLPLNVLITRWFVRQRNVALALFTSGFATGGVFFVPLLTYAINSFGWRMSYVLCAAAVYAVVLPLAWFVLKDNPGEIGLGPDGDPIRPKATPINVRAGSSEAGIRSVEPDGWTVREAMRTPAFWLIAVGLGLTFMVQVSFNVHTIPLFVSLGLSVEAAAVVVSAYSAVIGLLRLPFGYLLDRTLHTRLLMILLIVSQGIALAVLSISSDPWALWLFVALWGFTGGGVPLLEGALLYRTFGDRHYGALLGMEGLVATGGSLLGPVFAGAIFDVTGSYDAAFSVLMAASMAAFTCFLVFVPPKRSALPSARDAVV